MPLVASIPLYKIHTTFSLYIKIVDENWPAWPESESFNDTTVSVIYSSVRKRNIFAVAVEHMMTSWRTWSLDMSEICMHWGLWDDFFVMSAMRSENPDVKNGSLKAERSCCALYWDDMVNSTEKWVQDGWIEAHFLPLLIKAFFAHHPASVNWSHSNLVFFAYNQIGWLSIMFRNLDNVLNHLCWAQLSWYEGSLISPESFSHCLKWYFFCSCMGYGICFSANELGGLKNVWGIREYVLSELWVMRKLTVFKQSNNLYSSLTYLYQVFLCVLQCINF